MYGLFYMRTALIARPRIAEVESKGAEESLAAKQLAKLASKGAENAQKAREEAKAAGKAAEEARAAARQQERELEEQQRAVAEQLRALEEQRERAVAEQQLMPVAEFRTEQLALVTLQPAPAEASAAGAAGDQVSADPPPILSVKRDFSFETKPAG